MDKSGIPIISIESVLPAEVGDDITSRSNLASRIKSKKAKNLSENT
jgi:hypothetical protein